MITSEKMLERINMVPDGAHAVVELIVQVTAESWGPDCTIGQASIQAIESAVQKLNNLLHPPEGLKPSSHGVKLLGARCVRVICEARRPD